MTGNPSQGNIMIAGREYPPASAYKRTLVGFGLVLLILGVVGIVLESINLSSLVPSEGIYWPVFAYLAGSFCITAASLCIAVGFYQFPALIINAIVWCVISMITTLGTGIYEAYVASMAKSSLFQEIHSGLASVFFLGMVFSVLQWFYVKSVLAIVRQQALQQMGHNLPTISYGQRRGIYDNRRIF